MIKNEGIAEVLYKFHTLLTLEAMAQSSFVQNGTERAYKTQFAEEEKLELRKEIYATVLELQKINHQKEAVANNAMRAHIEQRAAMLGQLNYLLGLAKTELSLAIFKLSPHNDSDSSALPTDVTKIINQIQRIIISIDTQAETITNHINSIHEQLKEPSDPKLIHAHTEISIQKILDATEVIQNKIQDIKEDSIITAHRGLVRKNLPLLAQACDYISNAMTFLKAKTGYVLSGENISVHRALNLFQPRKTNTEKALHQTFEDLSQIIENARSSHL